MMETNDFSGVLRLPVIALRGKVLFPRTLLNFDVARKMSVNAVNTATEMHTDIFIASQLNAFIDAPKKEDVCTTGVIARIKQIAKLPNGVLKLSVEAIERAKIVSFCSTKEFFSADIVKAPYIESDPVETEAHFRVAKKAFLEYATADKRINKDMMVAIDSEPTANFFLDGAMSVLPFKESDAYSILDIDNTIDRLIAFEKLLNHELEIVKIQKKIDSEVRSSIDKGQKEYYLREQLKVIHNELGDGPEVGEELRQKIKAKNLEKSIEEKVLKEVDRLDKVNPSSPDYSVILNYLDWILELPFNYTTVDTENLKDAKAVLDADHFGLEKVKSRIVEYLAVLQLTKEIKGPILCFVGPPGVGKTSIATSIARALNRKFVRMSLGGVKDEAEIRGHRKTYVGAMPGRIIYGLRTAGSNNPVFLLDEIDKLSSDIHGDPASALLEVLDPEQNATFRDRYLEVPYDLSKVMFITTANSLDGIPYPLLDRMEVIEITGYTDEEKREIAKQYLIPKQLKNNGITEKNIEITDDAIDEIISGYTLEAGVRNLEREIAGVIRKVAVKVAEHPRTKKQIVTQKEVFNYLGVKKYTKTQALEEDRVGVATGLAWTSVGGVTLSIEVSLMKGKGEILLTGKLGDVMKESARAALSYIRANATAYGIDDKVFEETDIHIHVPEGATPKDGPSAGITMATALLSAFTKRSVKNSVAMTGEITLRGKVLAIGGLKEKALAAFRRGIKTVIVPEANKKDITEIPFKIRKQMKFVTVKEVEEVFKTALNK